MFVQLIVSKVLWNHWIVMAMVILHTTTGCRRDLKNKIVLTLLLWKIVLKNHSFREVSFGKLS